MEEQKSGGIKKRFVFVDVLNVVACIAVVLLHTSLSVFVPSRTLMWAANAVAQAIAIFATPVFFMISGMNLLNYRQKYSTSVFFRKRLLRTGRALLVGSLACYIILCLFPRAFYGAQSFEGAFGLKDFVKRFLTNQINDTYWFLYSIIYLYILTPLLSLAAGRKRILEYLIGLCLLVSVCIPCLVWLGVGEQYFANLFGWPLFSSSSLLYFLLGYYLREYVDWKRPAWNYALAYLVSTVLMALISLGVNGYFSGSMPQAYDNMVAGVTSPLCVVQAASIFMLFKSVEPRLSGIGERAHGVVRALSAASLNVYLYHVLLINLMGVQMPTDSWWMSSDPFTKCVVIYCLTAAVVVIAQRTWSLLRGRHANS